MEHLTCKQYADKHGLKEKTVRQWINRGKLKAEKHGRDWAIPEGTEKPKDRRKK
jgi:excisionase family DNA binding protein